MNGDELIDRPCTAAGSHPDFVRWEGIEGFGIVIVHKRALVLRVMDVFRTQGVYAGGRLLVSDLQQEWRNSGFRDADLETAVASAMDWGVLTHHPDGQDSTYRLITDSIPPPPGNKPWLQRIWESTKDAGTIQRASSRARQQSAEQKRRKDDPG